MKRFFYTDPLAAAWMAKHFEMNIGLLTRPESEWYSEEEPICGCVDLPANDLRLLIEQLTDDPGEDYVAGKLYIHPDSLHLLEPRKGDVCQGISGWDDECFVMKGDGDKDHLSKVGAVIIQRNGVSFMWPESEEA